MIYSLAHSELWLIFCCFDFVRRKCFFYFSYSSFSTFSLFFHHMRDSHAETLAHHPIGNVYLLSVLISNFK